MFEFFTQHAFWTSVAAYWIFSAAISSLPFPVDNGSPVYLWLYRFLHTIAGNINTAFGDRIPSLKGLALGVMALILLTGSACAAQYRVHPGALSVTDSAVYDTLRVAEAAIDQARTAEKAGDLPDRAKAALNVLIRAYNSARETWLDYRDALASQTPSQVYLDRLPGNLADLTQAIRTLQEAK